MAYVDVEVEVELDMFSDKELIEECKLRGMSVDGGVEHYSAHDVIRDIYNAKARGQDYEPLLRDLFYRTLGRVC